jgi:ketosteroid isomerase-like protein
MNFGAAGLERSLRTRYCTEMADGNVQAVHRAFDAFARADIAAWREVTDPELEAVPVGDWPEAEICGQDAVWDFLVAADEPWQPGRYELTEVIEGKDRVVARMRRDLRGRSSGVEVEYDYWVGFTLADGRATRVEWFATRDEAVRATGVSGQ